MTQERAASATLVDELAEMALSLRSEPLTATTATAAKAHLLDAIGCSLSGTRSALTRVLSTFARRSSDSGPVDVLGIRGKHSLAMAVSMEATLTHVDEFDALHAPAAVGPAGPVVVPAFLVAAVNHCSGRELLNSMLAGFELMIEVASRFHASSLYGDRWWPSSVFGPIGAAAAVSHLFDLDTDATRQAIALAATRIGGLLCAGELLDGHYLLNGRAAEAGLEAAVLALSGARADRRVLNDTAPVALRQRLGDADHRRAPHILATSLKAYPCSRPLHAAVDGLNRILSRHNLDSGDVESVFIELPEPGLNFVHLYDEPRTPPEAQASATFVIRATLAGIVGTPDAYRDPATTAPTLGRTRVGLGSSADLTAAFPAHWGANVTVRSRHGDEFTETVRDPPGDPSRPLEQSAIVAKFRHLADPVVSPDVAEQLVDRVEKVHEERDCASLRELLLGFQEG